MKKLVRESIFQSPEKEEVKEKLKSKVKEDPVEAYYAALDSKMQDMIDYVLSLMPDIPEEYIKVYKDHGFKHVDKSMIETFNVHPKTWYKEGKYEQLWLSGFEPEEPEEDVITLAFIYGDGKEAVWVDVKPEDISHIYFTCNEIVENHIVEGGYTTVFDMTVRDLRIVEDDIKEQANPSPDSIF